MVENEENINITVTMPKTYATYIDIKRVGKDMNRSQFVRGLIRKDMVEDSKVELKKTKGGKK